MNTMRVMKANAMPRPLPNRAFAFLGLAALSALAWVVVCLALVGLFLVIGSY